MFLPGRAFSAASISLLPHQAPTTTYIVTEFPRGQQQRPKPGLCLESQPPASSFSYDPFQN